MKLSRYQTEIINQINWSKNNLKRIIVIGDFNAVIDPSVDRLNKQSHKIGKGQESETSLLNLLQDTIIDTFIMATSDANKNDRFMRRDN